MILLTYDLNDIFLKNNLLNISFKDANSIETKSYTFDRSKFNNEDYILLNKNENEKIYLTSLRNIIKIELENSNYNGKVIIYKADKDQYNNFIRLIGNKILDINSMDIVEIVEKIIEQAILMRTTDIHIEILRDRARVRYRVDGVLKEMNTFTKELAKSIISRIKILSNLDIVEKSYPQDGRFSKKINGENIDFRVSTIPTMYGEKIELRLLYKIGDNFSVKDLYLNEKNRELFERGLKENSGIIILNGPTGSGKSTSLYIMIKEKNSEAVNISTVEDPIEYEIDGVNQVQCREDLGLDFSNILKFLLRQDPDILVIGEIRDRTTAQIAVKSSLTGHLVLTTLHSKDGIGAISRLENLDVDKYLLNQVLNMIISQRLVRKLCPCCKEIDSDYISKLKVLGLKEVDKYNDDIFYKAVGCEKCFNTGYIGRIPIMEIIYFDDDLKKYINQDYEVLLNKAREKGTTTMLCDAIEKAKEGLISLDEIMRQL